MIDVLVALIIVLGFAIRFYSFQTYLAHRLADYMSEELNAQVSIDALEIDLIKRVELKGFFIRDLRGDTLLYAPKIKCLVGNYSLRKRYITLKEISLKDPRIRLAKYQGEKDLNFEFIADYFDDGKKSPKKKDSKPWKLNIQRIKIEKASFSMDNYNKSYSDYGVDFDHLGLKKLNVDLSAFHNYADTSVFLIRNLSFNERSGFVVDTLNTRVKITPRSLTLTPFSLRTPYTNLNSPYLSFGYKSFDDFDDFEEKVVLNTYLARTQLNLGDLSYFVHDLRGSRQEIFVNGKFKGTIDDFETENLTVAYSPRTQIRGDFRVRDITHMDRAYFDLDIKNLELDGNELRTVQVPPYDDRSYLELPAEVYRLGNINYAGTFKGTLDDFASAGSLVSSAGNADADITYRNKTGKKNQHHISGHVVTQDLDVGLILDEPILGKVTGEFNADVASTTTLRADLEKKYKKGIPRFYDADVEFMRNMQVKIDSKVQSLGFNGYAYQNTTVEGNIRDNTFTGKISIRDENAYVYYNGYFDYGKKIPEYNFKASVYNAAITRLNFGNRDESATISFKMTTNGKGLKIDDLRGKIDVTNIVFCEFNKDYVFEDMHLNADELPDKTKKINFTSEVADLNVEGNFSFAELTLVFKSILSKAVPAMFDNQVVNVDSREVFRYNLTVKDFSKIQKLFLPDLELSKNISINGRFDSDQNIFRLSGRNIDRVRYGDREFRNLRIDTKNNDDFLNTEIRADNLIINDSIQFEQFNAQVNAFKNDFTTTIRWDNNASKNYGRLSMIGKVETHNQFSIKLDTSRVQISNGLWKTIQPAYIRIDSTDIAVKDFHAKNGDQSIVIDGSVSHDPQREITATLNNFRLETLTPLFVEADLEFKGGINGFVTASNIYETPAFKNHIQIDSFFVNREWVGDVTADNVYEKGSDTVGTRAVIKRKGIPNLNVEGYYHLKHEKNSLNYKIVFNETNLRFLNGFLPEDVSNFQSLVTGNIDVKGTPEKPDFHGKLNVHNGYIKINMLNASYFLEDGEIEITNDMIALNRMTVMDVRGNGGKMNGTYYHDHFKNGNFSFDLNFDKMLCLNTTEAMNDLYYGKAFATGEVSLQGYGGNIDLVVNAKTEKNTKLTLPMYGVSDITLGNFVTFNTGADTVAEKKIDLTGITLNFDLNVTPDAEINIVFDKLTGQQLKARGHGDIKMEITPLGDFVMTGDYEIENPSSYKLAMQSIINKNFVVAKGGTIKWYGDPLNAEVDITAVYKVQASVYEIMPADLQSSYRKNMEVLVEIRLRNSLYRPDFVFDINVPKGDENVKAAVASVKSTQEELFRQTMALLIVNKFLTPANAIGTASSSSGGAAANYTSELVTNQLNSLLSQISKDFDIGVNYKPGDEISNREIALALSTQILNGRINLSGNFGVSQSAAAAQGNQNNVIGDFNIEYLVTDDGNVRVRAYNESNSFDITKLQQAPYTQGVGLSYQKEFNTARDLVLLQRFLNVFRKPENDVKIIRKTREQRRAEKEERREANRKAREERRRLEQGIDPENPDNVPPPVVQ